ncbi:MAG: helix-turn-helix transcriptional regulator [Acidobacteria bacterium]|nr:helix-turn-helix transcriptional regulator [Acidobacteriota bacterium]
MTSLRSAGRRSDCPVNVALELLGDRWSLLIVRDLMFRAYRTYGQFLEADEGIATNILADRLRKLVASGIVATVEDDADHRKINYRLTAKGIGLAPAMTELILWSARHEKTFAPRAAIRRMEKHRDEFLAQVYRCWKEGGPPVFLKGQ